MDGFYVYMTQNIIAEKMEIFWRNNRYDGG